MRTRSWRWLQARIIGLLDIPQTVTPDGRVVENTRLGLVLRPPGPPPSTAT